MRQKRRPAYVITDTHGHIEEMNLTAQVLLGIKADNWKGLLFEEFLHINERESKTVLRTAVMDNSTIKRAQETMEEALDENYVAHSRRMCMESDDEV